MDYDLWLRKNTPTFELGFVDLCETLAVYNQQVECMSQGVLFMEFPCFILVIYTQGGAHELWVTFSALLLFTLAIYTMR